MFEPAIFISEFILLFYIGLLHFFVIYLIVQLRKAMKLLKFIDKELKTIGDNKNDKLYE